MKLFSSLRLRLLFAFTALTFGKLYSQETDTSAYTLYKERVVWYSDLGFNAAPFTLHGDFNEGVSKLRYKHNLKSTMGLGVMYKWFSLRVGFGLPGHLRPRSRFGESRYLDLGLSFNFQELYWDIDIKDYQQYVIVNAYKWNDTLTSLKPNDFRPNTRAVSFSTNGWYFPTKDFNMSAIFGKVGHVNREIKTWYGKASFNIFGIGNDYQPILPHELVDTTNTKTAARTMSALDVGIIPGYAYANRVNNWQIAALAGLGGVVQAKFYDANGISRGFLGIAPRVDLRLIGGYSTPSYFCWLVTDLDIKSIRYKEMRYNQTFYALKLVAGYRFERKKEDDD